MHLNMMNLFAESTHPIRLCLVHAVHSLSQFTLS